METNQEWTCGLESNPGADFLVPDSLGHESDLLSDLNDTEFPALQYHSEPGSPVLFEFNEDLDASMTSKRGQNPFEGERDTETDGAEALVADTASDFSENSSKEDERNVTVISRGLSRNKTLEQPTSTPAQMLTCLQLSGNPTLVPETCDSLDAVPPSLDAFDHHPTIVPDSPTEDHENKQRHNENDKDSDDDGVVSFKPLIPTMENEEAAWAESTTQQSLGVIESQNFILRLSQSQATSVTEKEDAKNADDFGLIPDAFPDVGEQAEVPAASCSSQNQCTEQDDIPSGKPSFYLQKPAIGSEDAVPPEDDAEGSVSVFKRIKSGASSPLKLKRLSDDSEEEVISKAYSKSDKHHKIIDLTESNSTKNSASIPSTTNKSLTQRKGLREKPPTRNITRRKDLFSDDHGSGLSNKNEQIRPKFEGVCTKELETNEEDHASTMVVSQDINSYCDYEDETMSYSYTEIKAHDSEKKLDEERSGPLEMAPNKLSDSGSDNFLLSQKRMVPKASRHISDSGEGLEENLILAHDNGGVSIAAKEDLINDKSMQGSQSLQDQQKNQGSTKETECDQLSSLRKEKSTDLFTDDPAEVAKKGEAIPSKEGCNVTEPVDKADSSAAKYQSFVEGSTLAQSISLDPYTFQGSQSQNNDTGPRMPLSDKPYISARGKKATAVKTMRKVLRKKTPYQEANNKSSSSDISNPETSKTRSGRRRKGSLQEKSTGPDVEEAVQSARFAALEDQDHFSRPHNPPPVKSCVKHNAGSSSSHPSSLHPSKDGHMETEAGQKLTKKSATVSFSTNTVAPGTVHDLPQSPDQEVERITTQEVITSEIIISKRTIKEVLNSKGQTLHKYETTEEIRRVKFEPQITQQDVTEKLVSSISPSRSTSTVTTGDLADISSSSLSRTFSSGSKPSLEVLPSSQSMPTPAQRLKSTQKSSNAATNVSNCEDNASSKAAATSNPSSFTVDVPPCPHGKPDSKRSSTGSNTGQDLFSTPNQSIINPADSQLGKVLSSSASSTPDEHLVRNVISPCHGISKGSVSHSPPHPGSIAQLTSSVTNSKEQPGSSPMTKSKSPHSGVSGETKTGQSEQNKSASEFSIVPERELLMKNDSKDKTNISSPQTATTTDISTRLANKRGRNVLSHSNKEDVESTDIQSTGFSIHGAPASGDSGKGLASTVASEKSTSVSAQVSLQGNTTKDQFVPCILNDYKSKPSIGAKVMGRWKDGFYYPGSLSKIEPGKKAMVKFDDGSQRWVRPHEIIMASDLPVGQSVMVLAEEEDEFYLPGMVMGHSEPVPEVDSEELFYQVERDDGVTQRCKRSSLILSEDQAACMLSDEELRFSADAITSVSAKPGDISLDNLVEGKRSLRSVQQPGPSSSKSAATSPPPSTSNMDTTGASPSKSSRKRKMGPMATSTPTPKQARRGEKGTPVKGNVGNILGSVISSPVESRKSPRKVKMGPLSPYCPRNSRLFEGIVFMLTHAEKSARWRAYEKQILQYSSLDTSVDDSTDNEPDVTPYDKVQLQTLIQQCGGRIVSSLNADVIASASQCFLVAAEHQRTVKYMQALAAGIQIVSHQWVLMSVKENQLERLVAYTLPAGISYEKRKLMEVSKGCPELSHRVIMVVSNNEDFVQAWTSILSLAGCQLTSKFPARASKNDPGVDMVVSDVTCPANVVRRCGQLNVPLVSSEWVAQCLINGVVVDVKGQEKYKHDFIEDEATNIVP